MYVNTIQQNDKETAAQFDQAINRYMADIELKGEQISNVTFLTAGDKLTAVFMIYTKKEIELAIQRQREQQLRESNGLIKSF